jgi:hypothetical protein
MSPSPSNTPSPLPRRVSFLPVSTATLAEVDIRAELDGPAGRLPTDERENRASAPDRALTPLRLLRRLPIGAR